MSVKKTKLCLCNVITAREKWTRLEQRIMVKLQVMYQCPVMQQCDGLINKQHITSLFSDAAVGHKQACFSTREICRKTVSDITNSEVLSLSGCIQNKKW